MVNEIYTKLNLSNNANDVLKIDKFLSRNQDLLKINKHIEQKKVQELNGDQNLNFVVSFLTLPSTLYK